MPDLKPAVSILTSLAKLVAALTRLAGATLLLAASVTFAVVLRSLPIAVGFLLAAYAWRYLG